MISATAARIAPPVIATPLPSGLPQAAASRNAGKLPADIAVVDGPNGGIGGVGGQAIFGPDADSPDPKYRAYGVVPDYEKGDAEYGMPPVLRLAEGSSIESAIAAAAQLSKQVGESERWNYAGNSDIAVGVFQAASGRMYLGSLTWASENNGNGDWNTLVPGNRVAPLVPELRAVVSEAAVARFPG